MSSVCLIWICVQASSNSALLSPVITSMPSGEALALTAADVGGGAPIQIREDGDVERLPGKKGGLSFFLDVSVDLFLKFIQQILRPQRDFFYEIDLAQDHLNASQQAFAPPAMC